MTPDLRDRAAQLEFILDHYQRPRFYGGLPEADVIQPGGNPGCGDVIAIYLKVKDGRAGPVQYTGSGCTISQAAASILLEHIQGLPLGEIEALDLTLLKEELGEEVINTRPRCATLALDTLKAAVLAYRRIAVA